MYVCVIGWFGGFFFLMGLFELNSLLGKSLSPNIAHLNFYAHLKSSYSSLRHSKGC